MTLAEPTSLALLFPSPLLRLLLCFWLNSSFWKKLSTVSSFFLSGYTRSLGTHFFRVMADELPGRGTLLQPSIVPCRLSLLIFLIHSSLRLNWRRIVLSKFLITQVPSVSAEKLVLHRHAFCVLSRLRCNRHSLQLYFSHSRNGRIENSSCCHPTQESSDVILHHPLTDSLRSMLSDDSFFSTTSGPGAGSCGTSEAP